MRNNCTLIFVYNEQSDVFSTVTGYIHKMMSPETYHCNLCKITHHNFGMKKEWVSFIEKLPFQFEFLNKDRFIQKYRNFGIKFPVIFLKEDTRLCLIASAAEIDAQSSTDDLKKLLLLKLSTHDKRDYSNIQ
jgi:hypothetical protein